MKFLLTLLAAGLLTFSAGAKTNITFWAFSTNQTPAFITVPTNQVARIVSFLPSNPNNFQAAVTIGNHFYFLNSNVLARPIEFVGPGQIQVQTTLLNEVTACTVELRGNEEIYQTPTGAVVIPADSSGPVEIILESSEDLVSWTAALPGTYGASTAKRFFRVRAVAN